MNRVTTIVVVCAWCNTTVGRKPGHGVEGISHTICPDCLPGVLKRDRESVRAKWRERHSEPVAS